MEACLSVSRLSWALGKVYESVFRKVCQKLEMAEILFK